jgi:uncharacterized protein YjbJ (UPF0337 family)
LTDGVGSRRSKPLSPDLCPIPDVETCSATRPRQCRSAAGTIQAKNRFCRTTGKEMKMDWNRVEGNWKQMKGKIKEKWGNLTDDDLTTINGKRDQLEGKIQERYGIAKDQVRRDVDDWYNTQTW